MSMIECSYLPEPAPVQFPPELALLIVRKAAAMAADLENQAIDQMTNDAIKALRRGERPQWIITQMGL